MSSLVSWSASSQHCMCVCVGEGGIFPLVNDVRYPHVHSGQLNYLAMNSHFCTILGQLVSDDLRGSLWNGDGDGNLQLTCTVGCSKSSIATRRAVKMIAASCC